MEQFQFFHTSPVLYKYPVETRQERHGGLRGTKKTLEVTAVYNHISC